MKKALIFVGIAGTVTAIALYYKKQMELLQNFTYKIIGFGVDHFKMDDALINLTIRVFSQSTLQAEVSDMNLDVFIGDVKVATVSDTNPMIVPAKGYSDVKIKVAFNPKQIGQNAVDLIAGFVSKRDERITMNGYMKIKSSIVKTSIPFTYTTTIKELTS